MTISNLPLSYCTNVHPGRTLDEVIANLEKFAVPVAKAFGEPMGVGLWFADWASRETHLKPDECEKLRVFLESHDLSCYTLNAFPAGDFHQDRVKDDVYIPPWSDMERLRYTLWQCAPILDRLLPESVDGSISTLPLGFKAHDHGASFLDDAIARLIQVATHPLGRDTLIEFPPGPFNGDRAPDHTIRLAIEPEPLCVIETTAEAIDFFHRLWEAADAQGPQVGMAVRNHIGLCYDVCHQAVEYEDAARSIIRLHKAGIRINKVQISNAIEVRDPANNPEALAALRDYVDERYLHQTFGRLSDGTIIRIPDLTHEFLDDPGDAMLAADVWRVHYHVPVDQETIGPLHTTRDDVVDALTTIKKLPYAPHLEVETYTWTVMPGEKPDIVAGLAAELKAVRAILDGLD